MVAYLRVTFLLFISKNSLKSSSQLVLILVVFSSVCCIVKYKENKDFAHNETVSSLAPILDTLEINGDALAFRAKAKGQKYQVYYTLQSEQEQKYFKNLAQNISIAFEGKIEQATTQRNFNGFDFQTYLKTQGIYRTITIDKIVKISENHAIFDKLQLWRRKAILFCERYFPKPMSSYMTGLLFGYLGKTFDEMGDIYTSLGIMHLFALSGMQVSFFIDKLRKLLLRLGVRYDFVSVIQIPLSILYAGLTGFSISVMRALIQKILTNFGIKNLDNFSLTLLILFILSPKFLLTAGGSLSICFAFIIAILGNRFENASQIKKLVFESLVLSFAVLPLLMLYFHTFQPFSIILTFIFSTIFDLLFLPALSLIFILAIFTGIKIGQINFIFEWLEVIVKSSDQIFHYPLVLGKPSLLIFLALLILSGFLIDFWQKKKTRVVLISAIFTLFFLTKNPPESTITILDIGQGDSIFLQDAFNQENILIDTGGRVSFEVNEGWKKRTITPNAENTLIPYLKSQGVGSIDTLVITHTDEDHMGDLLSVINQIKVKKIVTSEGSLTNPTFVTILKKTQAKIQVAQLGQQLKIFDSYLEVIYPLAKGDGKNDDSIVLYGNLNQTKFLFTGDLEATGEAALLSQYPTLDVEVLKAGHHGSKTSSSDVFIKTITPTIGLISCGLANRYHHPNDETLATFTKYHVKIYRTDLQGAIQLIKKGKSWQIVTVK
jgi:competence protein ComEC